MIKNYISHATILFSLIFLISCMSQQPICGNGILEEGETSQTCCEDTRCIGDQSCVFHQCVDPVCDSCSYLENHKCVNYECCLDDDCDDDNPNSEDKCISPGTQDSFCKNTKCNDDCTNKEKECFGDGYRTCGNYDSDPCFEWSQTFNCPANTICKQGECINENGNCEDGTIEGECSLNQPYFCNNGELIKSTYNCGCPLNKILINDDCKTYGAERTLKIAFIEIMPDKEIKDATYYCTSSRCVRIESTSPPCNTDNPDCDKYVLNYLDVINNKNKITSIHLGGKPLTPGKLVFDIPIGPWYSLYYIDDWLAQESIKYTSKRKVKLDIEIIGPYTTSLLPPERGRSDDCSKLTSYFEQFLTKDNIQTENYDVINFLYLDVDSTNRFISCAFSDKKHTYNNLLTSMDNINLALETPAHEIVHVLGATDRYSGFLCDFPEGIPKPNKEPLYPQEKACIMCGHIMTGEKESGSPTLLQSVVCDKDAQEIGWKNPLEVYRDGQKASEGLQKPTY